MGVRNYLIDGGSGTGKTAVCKELQRRGYHAINGDRELAYLGDPETGKPTDVLTHQPSAVFRSQHHIWDVETVRALVADQGAAMTFFCGNSRNSAKFIDLFDGVFILDVDLVTVLRRIDERVTVDPTDWGATPAEREIIVRLHQTKDAIPGIGMTIDATRPLAHVVDEILRKTEMPCGEGAVTRPIRSSGLSV